MTTTTAPCSRRSQSYEIRVLIEARRNVQPPSPKFEHTAIPRSCPSGKVGVQTRAVILSSFAQDSDDREKARKLFHFPDHDRHVETSSRSSTSMSPILQEAQRQSQSLEHGTTRRVNQSQTRLSLTPIASVR